jgi:hypothetical protein
VKTAEHGEHSGFIPRIGTGQPQVGHQARIRIYDAGGGWYPDNKIMSYGVSTI